LLAVVLVVVPGGLIVWQHTTSQRAPAPEVDPVSTAVAVPSASASPEAGDTIAPAAPVRPPPPAPVVVRSPDPGRSPLADKLNAADGDIRADLAIVDRVLDNFRLELGGNPVGTNREITAQLSGRNARRHAPLPPDHPAINSSGQLVDRWGTPFFFHAVSAQKMEIRSAGPDRELYSDDDAVSSPLPRGPAGP
jgi:hypothetical protein